MLKKTVTFLLLLTSSAGALAQSQTGSVQITSIITGWRVDEISLTTSATSYINPAGCAASNGPYAVDGSDPGFKVYYAAALTAIQNKQPVSIVVDNAVCGPQGRPKIIGITLYPN